MHRSALGVKIAALIVAGSLILAACGGVPVNEIATPEPTATSVPSPAATPVQASTNTPVRPASPVAADHPIDPSAAPDGMIDAIEQLLANESGVYGVQVMNADGVILYTQNDTAPFIAASLYKLVLLAEIFAQVEAGTLSLDQTLEITVDLFDSPTDTEDGYYMPEMIGSSVPLSDLLFYSGAFSSNVGARALRNLTTNDQLRQRAVSLGMKSTWVLVDPLQTPGFPSEPRIRAEVSDYARAASFVEEQSTDGEVNLTTPGDVAHYFSLLLDGKVVSEKVSEQIRDILSQQQVDDRFPPLLPAGTELIHKTGNLDHVVHDVGVIYGVNGPLILVALVQGCKDDWRATEVIQRLALIVYGDNAYPPFTF